MKRLLMCCLLAGCNLAPRYNRPELDMPSEWRTCVDTCLVEDPRWWMGLGDPVLNCLVDQALCNNQDLQVAIARVDAFQARLGVVRSELYPEITLNTLNGRQKIATSVTALPPSIQDIFNSYAFVSHASYLIDLWGEVRNAVAAAGYDFLSSIEARRIAVLSLVSSVTTTYMQLRQFDAQLVISQETLQSRQEAYEQAKIRFELGLTALMPVAQALSELDIAEIEIQNYEIVIAETENLMSLLLGVPSMAIPRGLSLEHITMPDAVPSYIPAELVCQRPDVRSAEQQLLAANARIGIAKAQFLPQLNVTGAYGTESTFFNQLFSNPATIWAYAATLAQEIFTGGRLTNNLCLSQAQKREMVHNYLSTILTACKEVNDALISHKINLETVETQRLRVEAIKSYFTLASLRYQEGETDYLTFLDAERQLFRGLLDYAEAQGNSFFSLIEIYKSLGGEWVITTDNAVMACP